LSTMKPIVSRITVEVLGGPQEHVEKAMRSEQEIHWGYTVVTILASGIIGAAAGILFDSDLKFSLIAGYVGTDILENTYKIIFKRQVLQA